MHTQTCSHCGLPFQPLPQVPNQTFCSKATCQRARKQLWAKMKLSVDLDYRENKRRAQREWMDRNPDYWQRYRQNNKKSNKIVQNDRLAGLAIKEKSTYVKKDESNLLFILNIGTYQLTPFIDGKFRKSSSFIVEISSVRSA